MRLVLRLAAVLSAVIAAVLTLSPTTRSVVVRLAALARTRRVLGDIAVTTAIDRGEWTRLVLCADLSQALSAVAKRPLRAVAYSHFGGFGRKAYSSWLVPTSPYYQAWLGAYVVRVDEGPPFGFDEDGKPLPDTARQLLEADQRLVLNSAGLIPKQDERPRVAAQTTAEMEQVVSWGSTWVRLRGSGTTPSAFQRGGTFARRRAMWLYGVVPRECDLPVGDFHTVTMHAALWYRYDAGLRATVAKFYAYSEYVNEHGETIAAEKSIADECEALLEGIRFDRREK